jgi:hypothetical protein
MRERERERERRMVAGKHGISCCYCCSVKRSEEELRFSL